MERNLDSTVTFFKEEPMARSTGQKVNMPIRRLLFADYGIDQYPVGVIASGGILSRKPK